MWYALGQKLSSHHSGTFCHFYTSAQVSFLAKSNLIFLFLSVISGLHPVVNALYIHSWRCVLIVSVNDFLKLFFLNHEYNSVIVWTSVELHFGVADTVICFILFNSEPEWFATLIVLLSDCFVWIFQPCLICTNIFGPHLKLHWKAFRYYVWFTCHVFTREQASSGHQTACPINFKPLKMGELV